MRCPAESTERALDEGMGIDEEGNIVTPDEVTDYNK